MSMAGDRLSEEDDSQSEVNRTAIAFQIVASIMLYAMSRITYVVIELSSFGRCVCFCEEQKTNCPVYFYPDIVGGALCWNLQRWHCGGALFACDSLWVHLVVPLLQSHTMVASCA